MNRNSFPLARWVIAALALALALHTFFPAEGDHSWRSASGVQYRWATPSIRVVDSVGDPWNESFSSAVSDWNRGVVDLLEVPGERSKACQPIRGAVRVCNAKYGHTGWAGLTELSVDSHGSILSARIRLNATYLTTKRLRRAAACHELGHALGLTHHSQSDSCLTPVVDAVSPNEHDYEQLGVIYR